MRVILANPRGFCAGVDRAIAIVNRALEVYGPPIYVRHEVVHNRFVVDDLKDRGAVFVEELSEVPAGGVVIFSAHGVSRAVQQEARQRELEVFDATCPLVTKVHIEVQRHARGGVDTILIGHAGHPEVEGTMGQFQGNGTNRIHLVEDLEGVAGLSFDAGQPLAFVTQTTLSVDDTRQIISGLQSRFPQITGPRNDDICYATQNRQDAVRALAAECEVILVVGSPNSSNSNRLKELAERCGRPAYLIDQASQLQQSWLEEAENIGVTAGASAPEVLVQSVLKQLEQWGASEIAELAGIEENIQFSLPKALKPKNPVS